MAAYPRLVADESFRSMMTGLIEFVDRSCWPLMLIDV